MTDYADTRARVEDYFDRTATRTWERLTSDAPVSRVRATVRAGRDRMRALMLSRLPEDLRGARILDAGCGAGQMTAALAARGADVVAVDIAPRLIEIAAARLPEAHRARVRFATGDMLAEDLGQFDHVLAMDSLIYYRAPDIAQSLSRLSRRTASGIVFTVAPRTGLLMAMWNVGKLFPRADRAPVMVPHSPVRLAEALRQCSDWRLAPVGRVTQGFYISQCLEVRP
jgi:magnesium-protoporphyrin O-methyltransferase